MFEPTDRARLFGVPPGADFPAELLAGLGDRLEGQPPEAWARVDLFVNTRRMARRLTDLFAAGPARLLPRIRLVTDLGADALLTDLPPPADPLARRLELTRLTSALLRAAPDLAPSAAAYDLADSLATLMDEMQGEAVSPDAIAALDVSDQSGHWQRAQRFFALIRPFFDAGSAPDPEARQRRVVEALLARWEAAPPDHPVIVAGSTGSRGTTALLMRAVARLPQGAVILPGVDFHMGADIWDGMEAQSGGEDHPQFRFAALARALDLHPTDIARWTPAEPDAARQRLISMALRPAPVTDAWLADGPGLGDLMVATAGMGLMEAPDPKTEALAIALRLRAAVEEGQAAALISPDRVLTRQVTAALDRWGIEPDDSAGRPLSLSAPGRLLRHLAQVMGRPLTPEILLIVLKHPLVHTGAGRGPHLRLTHELELWLRRSGPPHPGLDDLRAWAEKVGEREEKAEGWVEWLAGTLFTAQDAGDGPLPELVAIHVDLAERLCAGTGETGSGELWLKRPGEKALEAMTHLAREAETGGDLTLADYRALVDALMAQEVRDPVRPHPGVMIWGTLEARVQGADLVILGGLNEGTWPEAPSPDPWLNRPMRAALGLLLPERRIGLSAHDFQQAAGAPRVLVTRARRSSEAETVMSRWLNRLVNLMAGLPDQNGKQALEQMRARGQVWLTMAHGLNARTVPAPAAPRPAPCPPTAARPDTFRVTEIQRLVRDPYAIYADRILRLSPLDTLRKDPDAATRGTVTHEIFERFVNEGIDPGAPGAHARLMDLAREVMAREVPWAATRAVWLARFEQVAPWYLEADAAHRADAAPVGTEKRAAWPVPGTHVTLRGTADRIDRRADGTLVVLDYKTGAAPTDRQIRQYDPQVLIEAAMAEAGAFEGIAPAQVSRIGHVKLGAPPAWKLHETRFEDPKGKLAHLSPDEALGMLQRLFAAYADPDRGYVARRAMERMSYDYGYDHLARFGEWDVSDRAERTRLP